MIRYFYYIALLFVVSCNTQLTEKDKVSLFQKKMDKTFRDSKESPLPKDILKTFKGLEYFSFDEEFVIAAKFKRTVGEKPFEMITTTGRRPKYVKYGEVSFIFKGEQHQLDVFQEVSSEVKGVAGDLFIPFTDLSSGVTTYGGGRYLDMFLPLEEEVVLNFNLAYNPYCAYNPTFSCPIPPEQNFLDIDIQAGVKDYVYKGN